MRSYSNLIFFPEERLICPYIYKKGVWEGDTYLMHETEFNACQGVLLPVKGP